MSGPSRRGNTVSGSPARHEGAGRRRIGWRAAAGGVGVAVALALVPVAAPAAVADTGSAPSSSASGASDGWGPRLTRACAGVPVRLAKVQRASARINGDAETRGSIAFLTARIERARAAGHEDVARLLSDRLEVRKARAATLPLLIQKLQDAQAVCAQHAPSGS